MAFGRSRRTAETATEALNAYKKIQQNMMALEVQVEKQRRIMQAMWGFMKQKGDLTDDSLMEKYAEIEKNDLATEKATDTCPKCNRTLQDNSKACIYCGTIVEKRRLF